MISVEKGRVKMYLRLFAVATGWKLISYSDSIVFFVGSA